ncbi:MAG: alpha/beta hydrolase [Alphaproteobacteria bacterium]
MSKGLAGLVVSIGLLVSASAFALGLDPAFPEPALGPGKAKGVVVWSHGRSITTEDSKSPTPAYLQALREDGWDVLRFNRLSRGDTLTDSSRRLAEHSAALKRKGYRQVVLAGQSFGAFLSLIAADASPQIDAVIATAPAAYGSFDEFYDSWRLNATKLYPLLEQVRRARVMVFYFHGDNFDPGGRGERSREILARRGLGFAVIDQPAHLTTHWAASSGLFLRRFGDCIRNFANNDDLRGEMACTPHWGTRPSADLKLPPDMIEPRAPRASVPGVTTVGSDASPRGSKSSVKFRDIWYGFYPNGREVMLGIESTQGDQLTAIYSVGPSIDSKHDAVWTRRKGRVTEDGFIFQEPGKSTLQFRPRQDGGLSAVWVAADGKTSMTGSLKPIDPAMLTEQHADLSPPVATAAANGDSQEAKH